MPQKILDEPELRNKRHVFKDRLHAGELLAKKLKKYAIKNGVHILAIPAGGVPVGYALARGLNRPLDVIIVRKVQIPWNTEAGFGAISWDGTVILNMPIVRRLGLSAEVIDRSISLAQKNILDRLKKFRGDRPFPKLKGKTALIVDDGLASGFTMLAAVKSVRKYKPKRIVVAVPTASSSAVELIGLNVDELVCLNVRNTPIFAVADAYRRWHDLSDVEAMDFLSQVTDKQ